jgi:hypothetical protein
MPLFVLGASFQGSREGTWTYQVLMTVRWVPNTVSVSALLACWGAA